MGAAEEELGVESEMTKRGEAYQVGGGGEIAGCDLSSVPTNPALRSQELV